MHSELLPDLTGPFNFWNIFLLLHNFIVWFAFTTLINMSEASIAAQHKTPAR